MSDTTVFSLPFLSRPLPRTTSRIQREVLRRIAQEEKIGLLELEGSFTNTRSSLAHLIAHDRYRTRIEDRVQKLVKMTRNMLATPGIESLSSRRDWTKKLARSTEDLEDSRVEALLQNAVTEESVRRFIRIIDSLQDAYVSAGYDPSDIIPSNLYTMAHLVASNFSAYDMTLNT